MFKLTLKVLVFLCIANTTVSLIAQTAPPESHTLQAILVELRQIRLMLDTSSIVSQRIQIMTARLQLGEAGVTRDRQLLGDARGRFEQIHGRHQMLTEITRSLEEKKNTATGSVERKEVEERLSTLKLELQVVVGEEQEWQKRVTDSEQQLRQDEVRLAELHEALDLLDRNLKSSMKQ